MRLIEVNPGFSLELALLDAACADLARASGIAGLGEEPTKWAESVKPALWQTYAGIEVAASALRALKHVTTPEKYIEAKAIAQEALNELAKAVSQAEDAGAAADTRAAKMLRAMEGIGSPIDIKGAVSKAASAVKSGVAKVTTAAKSVATKVVSAVKAVPATVTSAAKALSTTAKTAATAAGKAVASKVAYSGSAKGQAVAVPTTSAAKTAAKTVTATKKATVTTATTTAKAAKTVAPPVSAPKEFVVAQGLLTQAEAAKLVSETKTASERAAEMGLEKWSLTAAMKKDAQDCLAMVQAGDIKGLAKAGWLAGYPSYYSPSEVLADVKRAAEGSLAVSAAQDAMNKATEAKSTTLPITDAQIAAAKGNLIVGPEGQVYAKSGYSYIQVGVTTAAPAVVAPPAVAPPVVAPPAVAPPVVAPPKPVVTPTALGTISKVKLEYDERKDTVPVSNVLQHTRGLLHVWGKNSTAEAKQLGINWKIFDPAGLVVENYSTWEGWPYTGGGKEHEFIGGRFTFDKVGNYTVTATLAMDKAKPTPAGKIEGTLCTVVAAAKEIPLWEKFKSYFNELALKVADLLGLTNKVKAARDSTMAAMQELRAIAPRVKDPKIRGEISTLETAIARLDAETNKQIGEANKVAKESKSAGEEIEAGRIEVGIGSPTPLALPAIIGLAAGAAALVGVMTKLITDWMKANANAKALIEKAKADATLYEAEKTRLDQLEQTRNLAEDEASRLRAEADALRKQADELAETDPEKASALLQQAAAKEAQASEVIKPFLQPIAPITVAPPAVPPAVPEEKPLLEKWLGIKGGHIVAAGAAIILIWGASKVLPPLLAKAKE